MTEEEIHRICKKYKITNYNINDDMSIDVDGDVNLYKKGLRELPLRLNKVSGYFNCGFNKLETLEGAPLEVGGSFYCNDNKLVSLKNSPKEVGGVYYCYNNNLKSLKDAPGKVGDGFDCAYNNLETLEGAPLEVGGSFYCHNNPVELNYNNYLKGVKRMNKLKQL